MWPRQQPGRESCQVVLLTPLLLPSWATSRARHICSSCASWTDAHAPQLLEPLAQCPHTHTHTTRRVRWPSCCCCTLQAFSDVFPHLVAASDVPKLVKIDDVDFAGVDAVFCCLPHATTQKIISSLPSHLKIVDLSADFRLADVKTYAEW